MHNFRNAASWDRFFSCVSKGLTCSALDLDADAGGAFYRIQFFDPNPDRSRRLPGEDSRGDFLGQGLDEVRMAFRDDRFGVVDDGLVAYDIAKVVADTLFGLDDRQVQIDPDSLRAILFMGVHPDACVEDEVANEDMAYAPLCIGDSDRLNITSHRRLSVIR